MDYEIFKTDQERKTAIQRLAELEKSEGWQILLKALDINLEIYQDELNTGTFETTRPVERLQDRLFDLRTLKQLPKLLIEEARNIPDVETSESDDPFEESPQELNSSK